MKWRIVGLMLWSIFVWAGAAAAQSEDDLFQVLGRYDSVAALDVEAVGDVLFYTAGPYVVAVDVSDPRRSAEIMRRQFGPSTAGNPGSYAVIDVVDSLAFVGVGRMLHVLDVRDPAGAREIGSTELGLEITNIHVAGGLAYTLSSWLGMVITDVSNPHSPWEVTHVGWPDLNWKIEEGVASEPSTYNAVIAKDTLAFLATGDWVHVINVADPPSPVDVGHVGESWVSDLSLRSDVLFSLGPSLNAYDIADPLKPALIGSMQIDEHAFSLAMLGAYALVSTISGRLDVIDVSNPADMVVAGSLALADELFEQSHGNGVLYLAALSGGVHLVDVSDPTAPVPLANIETGAVIQRVAVHGNAAYVAASQQGLVILDVSDPAQPSRSAEFELGEIIRHVAVENGLLFAAGRDAVHIFDASDPLYPDPVGVANPFYRISDLAVQDSFLYVSAESDLYVYDVTDPLEPREIETLAFCQVGRGCVREVDVEGSLAVLGGGGDLQFIDVTDPRNLVKTHQLTLQGDVQDVRLRDELAFVAVGGTMIVLDVSNTAAPVELASLDLGVGKATNIVLDGDDAYVSAGIDGIVLVDVSQPAAPRVIGRSALARYIGAVDPNGPVYGVASTGLVTFERRDIGTVVEDDIVRMGTAVSVYPNPARSEVRFRLEAPEPVRIAVFDLMGRRLRVLEGSGEIVWDGRDASGAAVPSGVYVCRIHTGGSVVTRGVVVRR